MTDGALRYFRMIMVTLGSKTKRLFTDAIQKEYAATSSDEHQIMNIADILRVCDSLKIDYLELTTKTNVTPKV